MRKRKRDDVTNADASDNDDDDNDDDDEATAPKRPRYDVILILHGMKSFEINV